MKCLGRLWVIMYLAGALAACGQKGPLVLPDAPKRKHTTPTMPGAAKPQSTGESSPAPADAKPATSPAPPANPSPQPAQTPPQP
jgi:predicted small lipoprotein YifL